MLRVLRLIGEYCLFLRMVFSRPKKWSIFFKRLINEMKAIGVDSLLIIAIVSVTMGSVITIQTSLQIVNSWIPPMTVGFTVRVSVIMELCPTIISLLLVGNIGSRITSEIGSMKVTEQIDALEVMGINPASYLIMPKIVASMIVNPLLIIISICFALVGGYITVMLALTNILSVHDFTEGLTSFFRMYDIYYALTKTFIFAFVISSCSSFYGYRIEGGALALGKASTNSIVVASFIILMLNLIITQIML